LRNPLRIYSGVFHPQLERTLFAEIDNIRKVDPLETIVILVGSGLVRDYLHWRLTASGHDLFNVHLVTFTSLARDLSLVDRLNDARPDLPVEGEFASVLRAIQTLDNPRYFKDVLDRSGFQQALTGTFVDLDEALIEHVGRIGSSFQADKLRTLTDLRLSYIESVKKFRRPLDDLQLPHSLPAHFRKVYQTNRLLIYGIYDFNTAQRAFLESFAGELELTVFLPFLQGDDFGSPFRYAEPTRNFFLKLQNSIPRMRDAEGTDESTEIDDSGDNVSDETKCDCYGERLFRFRPEDMKTGGISPVSRLTVFNASDPAAEAKDIVGRINEAMLWKEIPLSRMGVLLWRPETYLDPLKYELDRAGIPYADTIGKTLDRTPEGNTLLSLIDLTGRTIERRKLIDLLTSTEINLSDPDTEPDPVAWEVISIETGIIEGDLNRWLNELDYLEKLYGSDDHQAGHPSHLLNSEQVGLFRSFIERIFGLLGDLPGRDSWDNFASRTVEIARAYLPESSITDKIIDTVETLRRLDEVTGKIEFEKFIVVLHRRLAGCSSGKGRYCIDGLTICDRMVSRGLSFDLLFIPGLAQGMVPVAPHEDPILNDDDRRLINHTVSKEDRFFLHLPEPLPLKLDRLDEERLLFTVAMDAAEKQIALSYPLRGSDGKDLLPSRFLLEVCRVMSGEPVESGKLDKLDFFDGSSDRIDIERLEQRTVNPVLYPLEWVRANVDTPNRAAALRRIYYDRSERYRRSLNVGKHRLKGDEFTVWDGVMLKGWATPDSSGMKYSASRLEYYAACPFHYFIRYYLKSESWEEPEQLFEPPPMTIGSIIHSVLERLYSDAHAEDCLTFDEDDMDWVNEAIKNLLAEEMRRERAKLPLPSLLWDLTGKRLEKRLMRFIREEMGRGDRYQFHSAEDRFDMDLTFDCETGPYTMHVRGKIDRIDFSGDGKSIRLIDYKTGKVHAKTDMLKGGRTLQLPLYLMTMFDKYPDVDRESSVAEYLHIDQRGGLRSVQFTGQALTERSTDLGELIKAIGEGIKKGVFPPFPQDNDCDRCDAQFVCDLRSRRSSEWRVGDPRVVEIVKARNIE